MSTMPEALAQYIAVRRALGAKLQRACRETQRVRGLSEKPRGGIHHHGTGALLGDATEKRAARHVGSAPEHREALRRVAECG